MAPHKTDLTAVGAVFILNSQVDHPTTFGDLSQTILKHILVSECVDCVCVIFMMTTLTSKMWSMLSVDQMFKISSTTS